VLESYRPARDATKNAHETNYCQRRSSNVHSREPSNIEELILEEMKIQEMIESTVRSEANVIDDEV
jgi:hypothetical protein